MISRTSNYMNAGVGVADERTDSFLDRKDDDAGYAGGFGQFTGLVCRAGHRGRSGEDAAGRHD